MPEQYHYWIASSAALDIIHEYQAQAAYASRLRSLAIAQLKGVLGFTGITSRGALAFAKPPDRTRWLQDNDGYWLPRVRYRGKTVPGGADLRNELRRVAAMGVAWRPFADKLLPTTDKMLATDGMYIFDGAPTYEIIGNTTIIKVPIRAGAERRPCGCITRLELWEVEKLRFDVAQQEAAKQTQRAPTQGTHENK